MASVGTSALAAADSGGIGGVVTVALPAVIFLLVALDYRNMGLRFYDFLSAMRPGGPNPRFTPDRLRVISAVMSLLGLGVVVYRIAHL